MWRSIALAWTLALCGCAAHKRGSPGRVVLENDCIRSINVTPKTYCDKPAEGGSFSCHDATVTFDQSCGPKLVVKSNKKEVKK